MSEADFNEFGAEYSPRAGRMSRATNVVGAAVSVALVLGAVIWGYRLAVRDAHGVPVIQAMSHPMRIAPEEAGGKVAAHTGLSVNRIAASGTAGDVPEQIILGEPPIELAEEDHAGIGGLTPEDTAQVEEDTFARTLALAEELARQAVAEYDEGTGAVTAEPEEPLPAGVIATSIRPMARPAQGFATAPAPLEGALITATTPLAAVAPPTTELAPDSIPVGTRLAQIGAFDDAEAARAAWEVVAARNPSLFEGKSRVIQPANSVGRTFYRLRVAGFATEDDSRRFCSAVQEGDLRCTPVTTR